MNEPLGIVEALQARHSALVSRLSPAARHQAFPGRYARPLPVPKPVEQVAVERLQREKDALAKENGELRRTIAELQAQLTTPTVLIARRMAEKKNAPADVIQAFLLELNARRGDGDEEWTLTHLTTVRRNRHHAMPRHVCIWLVRHLCSQVSLPRIGRYFGNRDHTSCMHACARAPHWLLVDEKMKATADAVLLRFGAENPQ